MDRKAQKCKQCGREIYFDGICISCRAANERNRILAMPQEEIDAAIRKICGEIESSAKLDSERDLWKKLVNYRDINTAEIAKAAFENGVFDPCEIYKDAPDEIIQAMLEMLMQDDIPPMAAGRLLSCLAVHGGEDVLHSFFELEGHPRKWGKKLHIKPSCYAPYGGWSYDENGRFLETNFNTCYPMVKGTLEDKKHSPVKIGVKTGEKCPHCGCKIVNLMEIDGRDPRLHFLGIGGVIKAKCCPNCFESANGDFCRYTIDGGSEMTFSEERSITEDYLEDEGIEELASNSYILGDTPVPLRYAADWEGGSSIGGFAFWIQGCDIRLCPDCGKPMKYLAQVQWDTVLDYMEGNAYIEICRDCKIIAILHQQT